MTMGCILLATMKAESAGAACLWDGDRNEKSCGAVGCELG